MTKSLSMASLAAGMVLILAAAAFADGLPGAVSDARKGVVTVCAPPGGFGVGSSTILFQEEPVGGGVVGSGIVLSDDGLILTANHIVAGNEELTLVLYDRREVKARVIASETVFDVALIKAESGQFTPLPWRDAPAEVGETVYAIGTPAVFTESPVPSVSRGMVCGVHRTLEAVSVANWRPYLVDYIETDAQVSPGQSGGAFVDAEGRLVGMCMAIYFPSDGRGKAMARPTDEWLKSGLNELMEAGKMPLGRLGLSVLHIGPDRAGRLGLDGEGALEVAGVTEGGPCEKAGVAAGDVLTRCDGRPVGMIADLRRDEMRLKPGSTVSLTVYRPSSGRTMEVSAVVAETIRRGSSAEFRWRGMSVKDISADLRRSAEYRVQGVLVSDVEAGGNAWVAGLRDGNVITELNDKPVRSIVEFEKMVSGIPASEVVRIRTTEGIGHIKGENDGR